MGDASGPADKSARAHEPVDKPPLTYGRVTLLQEVSLTFPPAELKVAVEREMAVSN